MSLSFFSPFLFLLSPKHVLERRKTHMCFAKSFTGFCGEPQISISFAQQKLLKRPFAVFACTREIKNHGYGQPRLYSKTSAHITTHTYDLLYVHTSRNTSNTYHTFFFWCDSFDLRPLTHIFRHTL